MMKISRMLSAWCPAPEPPAYRNLRQYSKPAIVFATTAILIVSILATSFSALSSTAIPPVAEQIQKSINSEPTPSPTSTAVPRAVGTTNSPAPTPTVNPSTTAQSTFTVSGYILDSKGKPITGAQIIFCVPDVIPAVFSDSSGHYQVNAPAGTYHIYVWPPFNSSYMSFEQQSLVVSASISKNVTLNTGYKLSGYIVDSGKPVNGAVVALDNYFNGYYSTIDGYYYVVAPSGNYTLTAHPKTGVNFAKYNESNVVISGDTFKNITIANQTKYRLSGYVKDSNGKGLAGAEIILNVPNVAPGVLTNSAGYYEIYAPAGTYHLNIWPPFDSNYLSYDQQGFTVAGVLTKNFTLTQGYKVSGYITNSTGYPVQGAIAMLGNQFGNHISGWYSKATGYYFVTAPLGNYTLTVQPRTGANFTTYTLNNFVVNGSTLWNINVVS